MNVKTIDSKLMYGIVNRLTENFSIPMSVCDASGRVVASTIPSAIGAMNLMAIEALNRNSKVIVPTDEPLRKAGAAMPLLLQSKRIGAVVVEQAGSAAVYIIDILVKAVEMLYEESLQNQEKQNLTQERSQFFYEWLNQQTPYSAALVQRGKLLEYDLSCRRTVILTEQTGELSAFSPASIRRLLTPQDILFELSNDQCLILLREDDDHHQRYHRILNTSQGCRTGSCSGQTHLYTAHQAAAASLRLGKILFPEDRHYDYAQLELAIALSKIAVPGLEETFALLAEKGENAQLAQTVIAFIRHNGDMQAICDALHIHRNSIHYRMNRIKEICGKDLTVYYDLMHLYASFIRYSCAEE